MKAHVEIEFESFGDLTTALYETIREVKHEAKRQVPKKKTAERAVSEPTPFESNDDNCYGSYEISVSDESPTPSRAGEISPVLPRWVKASERLPNIPRKYPCKENGEYFTKYLSLKYNGDLNIEWLEEITPTPEPVKDTPEQKEPEEIRCLHCGALSHPDKDGAFRKKCWYCDSVIENSKIAAERRAHIPDPKGEIPEGIRMWIEDQLDKHGILAGSNIFKEGAIAMYRKIMEEDVMKANTRYSDTILDLRKAEKAVATLTKERDELKCKVDNKVIPIREPELIPSESNAYVIMADGSRSRTLGELFQLIPQVHRKQIMGATGPGTSLCAVLEYVARYGEEIRSQCNQQREEVKEELEQVKLSFHQAAEEVKRLTAQLSGK